MDTIGPYHLEALVGRGTAGSVWRATRPGPVDQVVAVKRARADAGPDGAARLRREAVVLADLDHPHIVRVLDVLDDGAGLAIVMSFARGGSLHDLLAERGRLEPGAVVAVLARVADALASAHRRGVFHGDVKPANILFTTDGEPLLGDFGVAQTLTPGLAGLDGLTGLGDPLATVEGTVGYVDPALVETGRPDPRNDVYGLGVVAYLALAGHLPHGGDEVRDVLAAADVGDHPPLAEVPDVPPALAALVESALARDPAARPSSAADLAAGLRAAVEPGLVALPGTARTVPVPDAEDGSPSEEAPSVPVAAPEDPPRGTRAFGPRPPTPEAEAVRGRPLLTGVVVVVLLVAAVGGGLWLRARLGAEQDPTTVAVDGRSQPRGVGCVALPAIEVPSGAQDLTADLAGDGCPTQVVWDGRTMLFRVDPDEERPRAYGFDAEGGPGQLVLGDWDCDGADTPAFYQPSTGTIAYFADVPEREGGEVRARTEDTGVTEGRATLDEGGDDGCDVVTVSAEA